MIIDLIDCTTIGMLDAPDAELSPQSEDTAVMLLASPRTDRMCESEG